MRLFKTNLVLLFLICELLYSQSSLFDDSPQTEEIPENQTEIEYSGLPGGFRSLSLGTSFEEAKSLLLRESRFDYRGDSDVSVQKEGNQSLISSRGRSFIKQGFFQFHENSLYLIILQIDEEKMDFFTLQQSLIGKYGPPDKLSPDGMYWADDKIKLSLEYPLTVKYLDLVVFNSFLEENVQSKSFQEIARTEFLEDF